ncbi:tetratricopeptide repeat protein [Sphingomonas sp. BAUL-RG-20F-R05-02]|uniref:O-linked N-acetylglucosamine transferase, SPINDLY family protein n=1 Tax=Sphingomonas sp. BAUL-RG-20F-R05-02 TaxID=2914830 RepID=UPI001F576A5E|nr:tetratricopeptide repeat protein [Sphingomonas sp. BAUL-RG-20F-R05-02]
MSGTDTIFAKAKRAERRGDVAEARRLLEEVLARYPGNRKAVEGLARLAPPDNDNAVLQAGVAAVSASYARGEHAQAARDTEALIARFPHVTALHGVAGAAYLGVGDAARAEAAFRAVLAAQPDDAVIHTNLGVALRRQERLAEAEDCHRRAFALRPNLVEAHYNFANLLGAQGRDDEAIAAYHTTLALRPDHADALYNLGNLLRERRAFGKAAAFYSRALAIRPDHADTLTNLGYAHLEMGARDAAVAAFRQAVAVTPDVVPSLVNLGTALSLAGALEEAHATFTHALALHPDDTALRAQTLSLDAHLCDWSGRDTFAALPIEPASGVEPIAPFTALPFEDDPARSLARARVFAAALPHEADIALTPPLPGARIRLGYFSADFHDHATIHLLAGLLREHDRSRFEIHAYSFGADTDEGLRQHVSTYLDGFHDLHALTDAQAVALARSHALDIAIDLKGHTRDARSGLFARRMAPVQIGYLGYPGSIGADFLDYIIADATVIPPDDGAHYSERVIRLPGSYQPNDDRRPIGPRPADRTAVGLPAAGFVFCCFNQHWKIGPHEWAIWMRLLCAVEGSVLWLIRGNATAEANLRKQAQARGVDPERLIFAAKLPHADHLARQAHADLFLDTFAVNAHTTASDALWGGLPVLTLIGRQFAARVAASLLTAIDLRDLIAKTEAEYEATALDLATDPAKLTTIKARLGANRTRAPLFDTPRYARAIEAAFESAHRRRLDGLLPAPITITQT